MWFLDVAKPPLDWWAWQARTGRHEPEVGDFLSNHLRDGDVFFDVGAHFGQYTLLAARKCARCFAFEPDPDARELLQRNLERNQLCATLVAAAVGDTHGGKAWLDPAHAGRSTSRPTAHGTGIEVPVVTLAGYCREHGVRPDVMKVDIEGAEVLALGGPAAEILTGVRALVVEIHEDEIRAAHSNPDELVRTLARGARIVDLGGRWEGNYNIGILRD